METYKTDRFKDAERAREATPYANKRVMHRLGGAVAIKQQKEGGGLTGNLYGTPYSDPIGMEAFQNWLSNEKQEGFTRYRNVSDPVSVLENSSKTSFHTDPWNYVSFTHDYHNQASHNFTASTDNAFGWKNQDGSISLRE